MNDSLLLLVQDLLEFVKNVNPEYRPEINDGAGNYDDTYYAGYGAAEYDVRKLLVQHGVIEE